MTTTSLKASNTWALISTNFFQISREDTCLSSTEVTFVVKDHRIHCPRVISLLKYEDLRLVLCRRFRINQIRLYELLK